jgi:hypothetical protein
MRRAVDPARRRWRVDTPGFAGKHGGRALAHGLLKVPM